VADCPASAGRPRFDIADIVRAHRAQLEREQGISVTEGRVLSAIERCRTAALGGHLDVCRSCGQERPAYNSCRNRHCPKCQALAQEKWIAARTERLLPVRHFHVVFTLPSELRGLCRRLPRPLFDALFRAASEALLELGRTRLAATLGVTMVLHTWTRDLRFHPHVHAIVTAGGLREDEQWAASNGKYLFPVAVMGALLRGKMMAELHRLHAQGKLRGYDGFEDPEAFGRFMARLPRRPWLVYAKRPFGRAEHVLRYLGRYTHRVAIANSRLVNVTSRSVTFQTRNGATATLTPVEFLRRFLQHVLPDGFKKIRHYGLYAATAEERRATACRELDPARLSCLGSTPSWREHFRHLTGRDVDRCTSCGGVVEHIPLSAPSARAPPTRVAA
jgi:hypothetical protein